MPEPWTDAEIEIALEAYFTMLLLEKRGVDVVKKEHVRRAGSLLPDRSAKSIEFKWCNISAVLDEVDLPWIDGYKPLPHYQQRLRQLTLHWLRNHPLPRTTFDS